MTWKVEFSRRADKQLNGLTKTDQQRIVKMLQQIAALDDPRQRGRLVGEFAGYWRYRISDYRVIVKIEDGRMVIIVIAVGHRREVYR